MNFVDVGGAVLPLAPAKREQTLRQRAICKATVVQASQLTHICHPVSTFTYTCYKLNGTRVPAFNFHWGEVRGAKRGDNFNAVSSAVLVTIKRS